MYVFVDLLFVKYKCGNMSFSLVLLLNAAWGGWVSWAIGGPSNFLPNSPLLGVRISELDLKIQVRVQE